MPDPRAVDSVTVAEAVRSAVEAIPRVAGVSAGRFARVGTYGPDRVVRGVALRREHGEATFEIHIVASSSTKNLQDLAESVRNVVRGTAYDSGLESVRRVDVVIEDLLDEDGPR